MGIIRAKNLNLWYTTNHALKDINIELPERQITACSCQCREGPKPWDAPPGQQPDPRSLRL